MTQWVFTSWASLQHQSADQVYLQYTMGGGYTSLQGCQTLKGILTTKTSVDWHGLSIKASWKCEYKLYLYLYL